MFIAVFGWITSVRWSILRLLARAYILVGVECDTMHDLVFARQSQSEAI